MYFAIRKCETSDFVLLSQNRGGYSAPWWFHMSLRMVFFMSVENTIGIFTDDSVSLCCCNKLPQTGPFIQNRNFVLIV